MKSFKQILLSESNDDIEKAVSACEGKSLFDCGQPLEQAFGKKNVSSLGMFPGFMIKTNKKTIAVLSASNVDDAEGYTKNKKIAVGYL